MDSSMEDRLGGMFPSASPSPEPEASIEPSIEAASRRGGGGREDRPEHARQYAEAYAADAHDDPGFSHADGRGSSQGFGRDVDDEDEDEDERDDDDDDADNGSNDGSNDGNDDGGESPTTYKEAPEMAAVSPTTPLPPTAPETVSRMAVLSVEQPQKVTDGSSAFVSYLVVSQTFADEKPDRVRRRFSDFAKLYDQLVQDFPSCAVPPLPDRWRLEYIAGDRFRPEFTSKRAAALERFLFRVSQHPYLRRSRTFMQFLSGAQVNSGTTGGPVHVSTTLEHLSDSVMNAFTKAKHQSKEMVDSKERADRFEHNVASIDKAVLRTAKSQQDLVVDMEDMSKQASRLARLEPSNAREFEALADTAHGLQGATAQLRTNIDSQFAGALRDMAHYVQALKGMLKQREQRQIDHEFLVDYLVRTEHELVAAEHGSQSSSSTSSYIRTKMNDLRGVDKEHARQQRVAKLKARITELRTETDKTKQISDECEELAKREVRVFEHTEALELQQSLGGLADSYIDYYQRVLSMCRAVENDLN